MIVSKRLQNRAMRYIVNYYSTHSPGSYIDKSSLVSQKICKEKQVDRLLNFLEAKKLIHYGMSDRLGEVCIQLLPDGEQYFENEREKKKSDRKEARRFWFRLFIDILIFLAGILLEEKLEIIDFLIDLRG